MATGFLGYESAPLDKAAFSLIPAPFDDCATFVNGQSAAPKAILEASARLEAFDEESGLDLAAQAPMHCVDPSEAPRGSAINNWLAQQVNAALDAVAVPVILGGDGSVSYSAIKAVADRAAKSQQELSVLHLDAHADLNPLEGGDNNLNVMTRVRELKNVRLCELGVRSLGKEAFDLIADDENNIDCFFMSDLRGASDADWQEDVKNALSSPVYVSIDLSVFDSAIMPCVGNPEPGGFNWAQVTRLLKLVAAHRRIAAFDVVELCPREGDHAAPYAAARLIYKLMNYVVAGGKMLPKPDAPEAAE